MEEDLESRLAGANTSFMKDSIISQLASRRYDRAASRDNPYFKYNLVPSIVERISAYAPVFGNFESTLNSKLNKDEAKRIYYGIVCMGEPNPAVGFLLSKLTDWEKVYFFAGVWKNRGMQGIRSKEIHEIVQEYVKEGLDFLHRSHMIKKADGVYKRKLKLPESQHYRQKQGDLKEIGAGFQRLLDQNDTSYESEERIGMFLEGCSENQLKYLTKRFGAEALSGYAVR